MGLLQVQSIIVLCLCVWTQAQNYEGCFTAYPGQRVECAEPVEIRSGISRRDCLALCAQYSLRCTGADYADNGYGGRCGIYTVPIQYTVQTNYRRNVDTSESRERPNRNGHRGRGRRQVGPPTLPDWSDYPNLQSQNQIQRHQGSNYGGRGRQATNNNNSGQCSYGPGRLRNCAPFTHYMTTNYNCAAPTFPTTPFTFPTFTTPTTRTTTTRPTTTTVILPAGATCPVGQQTRYTFMPGFEMNVAPDQTFTAQSELQCITACTDNRLPSGQTVPCRSVDFTQTTGQCQMSFERVQPNGIGVLNANAEAGYYEKICVVDNSNRGCTNPTLVDPQHLLIGFAETVVDSPSLAACLQSCLNSQAQFGFECNSGMMFYDNPPEQNCVLNSQTASNHQDLYQVAGPDEQVDYFEPNCLSLRLLSDGGLRGRSSQLRMDRMRNTASNDAQPNLFSTTTTYGQWTKCNGTKGLQRRYKACESNASAKGCMAEIRQCSL